MSTIGKILVYTLVLYREIVNCVSTYPYIIKSSQMFGMWHVSTTIYFLSTIRLATSLISYSFLINDNFILNYNVSILPLSTMIAMFVIR